MRIILPFVCLILYTQSFISQNLNVAEHEGLDKTGRMVSIDSKVFYIGGDGTTCCFYQPYVKGIKDDGSTIFKTGLPGANFGKIIATNDKALFFNYWSAKACDISSHIDYIVKLDTNGNTLFSIPIQSTSAGGFSATITDITQHPDSSYFLSSSSDLYNYSANGLFISKISTGLTSIVSLKALNNGKLFIHGTLNGNKTNVLMLTNGTIIKQGACVNSLTKVLDIANDFYALSVTGVIEKYDSTLSLIKSFDASVSPTNYYVSDFTSRQDSLFVVGRYFPGNFVFYSILDTGFNQVYQNISSYKGILPTGIALSNKNKINIITTSSSVVMTNYAFSGFFQLGINGTFVAYADIGVVGFSEVNTRLNLNQGYTIFPYIDMHVTVKNFGTDTVKKFFLNYYANYFLCPQLLHKECKINIAPGQTLSIPTGSFYAQTFPPTSGITSKKLNICIFTTIPNNSNDIEITNDAYCDTVLFTVTGISENSLLEQSIQVYPNPSSGGFTIDSDVEIKTLELINVLGEIVKQERINAKEYYLDELALSPGIYFIKLETEKGSVQKKVIKH